MLRKRYWHIKNKWRRHLSLAGHPKLKRHIPPTSLLNKMTLRRYLDRYKVIFVKPVYGSFGNRIIKIQRSNGTFKLHRENTVTKVSRGNIVRKVLQHTRNRKYHLQKGVQLIKNNGHPVDYRVLLLRPDSQWELMGIMGKVATGKRIVTNYQHGGRPIGFEKSLTTAGWSHSDIAKTKREVERLCLIAAKRFQARHKHCRRLGIDIALDEEKRIWFIEVNTNPYYDLFRHHRNRRLHPAIDRMMRKIGRTQSDKW